MGRMGLGYGSEFHLLRWLGRHRGRLTRKVCALNPSAWKNVEWLDFNFAPGEFIPDAELLGLDFLQDAHCGGDSSKRNKMAKARSEFLHGESSWARAAKRSLMNWDAIGMASDGTYILCEAKAHLEEVSPDGCGARAASSRNAIGRALEFAKRYFNARTDADWLGTYYQMANRLYVVALLESVGLKAALLNIYFTGDIFPGGRRYVCPADDTGWHELIDREFTTLGLDRSAPEVANHVFDLFLPVNGGE